MGNLGEELNVMPKTIKAVKAIHYDVQQIVESLMAENEIEASEVTLDMVLSRIQDWVEEDFIHDNADSTVFLDENDEEI